MKTILTIILIFFGLTISAQKSKNYPTKICKYTYADFMNKYGVDDTSEVMIDLFLTKRNVQSSTQLSFYPILISLGFIVPPIGVPLTVGYTPVAAHGGFLRIKYSKRRLEKMLNKHHNGEKLGKHLRKKIGKHKQLMLLDHPANN